jgi:hypothetical protein
MRRQPHHDVQFAEPPDALPDALPDDSQFDSPVVTADSAYTMTATEVRYEVAAIPVQVEPAAVQLAPTFVTTDALHAAHSDAPVFAHDDLEKFQVGDMQFTAQSDEPMLERVSDARLATVVTDEFENWPMPEHTPVSQSGV